MDTTVLFNIYLLFQNYVTMCSKFSTHVQDFFPAVKSRKTISNISLYFDIYRNLDMEETLKRQEIAETQSMLINSSTM